MRESREDVENKKIWVGIFMRGLSQRRLVNFDLVLFTANLLLKLIEDELTSTSNWIKKYR
jgi:hypothetical protein